LDGGKDDILFIERCLVSVSVYICAVEIQMFTIIYFCCEGYAFALVCWLVCKSAGLLRMSYTIFLLNFGIDEEQSVKLYGRSASSNISKIIK